MLIIDEILKQLRDVEFFLEKKSARVEKAGASLFLEYLGFGPAGGRTLRLIFKDSHEVEMHFEKSALCWLPYYLRDSKTGGEIFLYEFVAEREPLRMDMEAGSLLLQRALFIELILRAQGFDRLDHESLYHPLFARSAS